MLWLLSERSWPGDPQHCREVTGKLRGLRTSRPLRAGGSTQTRTRIDAAGSGAAWVAS
jgi:hypothetical protein